VRNHEKAIEQLSEMVRKYPADSAGFSNLAYAYSLRRDLANALEYGRKAVEVYPKNLIQHNNVAIYALYAGDFETAKREAKSVLETNPGFLKAHVVAALSELSLGRPEKAAEEYGKLEKISDLGASFAAIGLADLALYQGRSADAMGILERRINGEAASNSGTLTSVKLAALASARLHAGKTSQALADAEKALSLDRSETLAYLVAHFYVEAGQEGKAAAIAASLGAQLLPEPRAYGGIIEGEILLKKGKAGEAARRFLDAQKFVDTWIGRFFLGRAYMELGQFTEAHTELEQCVKRRGESVALFLDEVPSSRYFPPLFYYLGKVHDGMKSKEAPDSFKSFLSIKQHAADNDPMIADARRLLAGR
jgi:tetratricopeptide (TPR) repeat protein